MFLTFFICQNNSLKKKKNQLFPPHNSKTDIFSEFVNHFFGVYIETALMKMFKGHLTMCFH